MSSNYTTTMEGFDASGVEYIHSSEIIEFFWFFASFLLLLFTCLRIFKYKENFSIEEKQINLNLPSNQVPYKQPQPQPPQNFEDKQSENQEDKIVLGKNFLEKN